MNSIDVILIFIIFTVSVWYVIQPLFSDELEKVEDDSENLEALLLKKNVLLEQIKELEMDHEIGNIDEEDFIVTRDEMKKNTADVLESIKKIKS